MGAHPVVFGAAPLSPGVPALSVFSRHDALVR
jgi:hypothetical protein